MPPFSLQKQNNFFVQKWQTEEYRPGRVTDLVRMWDLVLPWQQMHGPASTCKRNCPLCEPRRWKFVTRTPRSRSFWGRGNQSSGIFLEFGGGEKVVRHPESSSDGVLIEGKHTNARSNADTIKASSQQRGDRIISSITAGKSTFSPFFSSASEERKKAKTFSCLCYWREQSWRYGSS